MIHSWQKVLYFCAIEHDHQSRGSTFYGEWSSLSSHVLLYFIIGMWQLSSWPVYTCINNTFTINLAVEQFNLIKFQHNLSTFAKIWHKYVTIDGLEFLFTLANRKGTVNNQMGHTHARDVYFFNIRSLYCHLVWFWPKKYKKYLQLSKYGKVSQRCRWYDWISFPYIVSFTLPNLICPPSIVIYSGP